MNKEMRRSSDEQWRELTRKFEAEVSHAEWTSLARRLDRHDRRRKTILRWGTFCVAVFALAFTGWLVWPHGIQPQGISQRVSEPAPVLQPESSGPVPGPYTPDQVQASEQQNVSDAAPFTQHGSVPGQVTSAEFSVPFLSWEHAPVPFLHGDLTGITADPFPAHASQVQGNTLAQRTATIRPRPRMGGTYLVVHVQPNWVSNRYQAPASNDQTVNRRYSDIRQSQEQSSPGINAGVSLNTPLWRGISVSGGLSVNAVTGQVNYNYTRAEIPVVDSATGVIAGYLPVSDSTVVEARHKNVQTYIEMPVMFSWQFRGLGRFTLDLGVGGSLMYLAGANTWQVDSKTLMVNDYQSPSAFNRWNTSLAGRIGLGMQLSQNWNASAGVQYQQILRNTDPSGASGRSTPSSLGLRLALGYRLF